MTVAASHAENWTSRQTTIDGVSFEMQLSDEPRSGVDDRRPRNSVKALQIAYELPDSGHSERYRRIMTDIVLNRGVGFADTADSSVDREGALGGRTRRALINVSNHPPQKIRGYARFERTYRK